MRLLILSLISASLVGCGSYTPKHEGSGVKAAQLADGSWKLTYVAQAVSRTGKTETPISIREPIEAKADQLCPSGYDKLEISDPAISTASGRFGLAFVITAELECGTLYRLIPEPVPATEIAPWSEILPASSLVFGFTAFGDFFITNSSHSKFGVLLTQSASYESVPASSIHEFESAFLSDAGIVRSVLRPDDINFLASTVGALSDGEVFFPVPYTFLGGSGELDTYQKGDVWVYASICGQSHGLGAN